MHIMLVSSCLPLFPMLSWTFSVYFLVHMIRASSQVYTMKEIAGMFQNVWELVKCIHGLTFRAVWDLAQNLSSLAPVTPAMATLPVPFPERGFALHIMGSRTLTMPRAPFQPLLHLLSSLKVQLKASLPCFMASLFCTTALCLGSGRKYPLPSPSSTPFHGGVILEHFFISELLVPTPKTEGSCHDYWIFTEARFTFFTCIPQLTQCGIMLSLGSYALELDHPGLED